MTSPVAAAPEAGSERAVAAATAPVAARDGTNETTRESWLRWRRDGLGGSDVAALVGLSPWQSPWSIFANKVGLIDEDDATEAMEFGQRIESVMADYFHDRTGLYVAGEQTWCSNPAEPWMRCTADGFVFDAASEWTAAERRGEGDVGIDDALGLAEWKSTSDSANDWEAEIPPHYSCQLQWSLAVTGLPAAWLGVLHLAFGRPQFRVYEIQRDEDDIALLTKAAREFWFSYVVTGTPPPVDAHPSTTAALGQAWDAIDGETVEADDLDLFNIDEARRIKAQVKALEEQLTVRENAIRARLGEATILTHGVDGKGKPIILASWKYQERVGHYVGPSSFRKLDIRKPKAST